MATLLPLAFLGNIMGMDGLVVLIIGLLIFGGKLPSVGRNLGRTIVEFKKGLNSKPEDDEEEEEEKPAPVKRTQQRISSVSTRPTKSLPQTEEV